MVGVRKFALVCAAKDCYVVGREAYIAENFLMSRNWMKEALTKYDEGEKYLGG